MTRKEIHPLVCLAKEAISAYIREGRIISPPMELTKEMEEKAGVFVSLKKRGALRGCIGTMSPLMANVAEEVIQNAISAATKDPRFDPVTPQELEDIEYSVDVLTPSEKILGSEELDPKKYGVIVKSGLRKGLLLPDLESVNTVEDQIAIVRQKAGIHPDEPYELYRFEVRRYK